MENFATLLNVTQTEALVLAGIVFLAGVVRGFSGFALSALVMASAVLILPPVELIPICWCLEIAASILMVRGGWKEADRPTAVGLVIGSAIGTPVGIALTLAVSISTSKTIALVLIISLALSQLFKINSPLLATKPGLWVSGFVVGIATGLASVGGMVVALYVMSRSAPAKKNAGNTRHVFVL
ncbi:MAG: sulfite exporter TauE/SafE family protein [Paracoccaceae bacterium]|nr:sulfite exporter TauE/SafE family protein [Paracoccaceae bacterium]